MAVPPTPVVVSGVTYDQSGSTWYQPVYAGGEVTYVVVDPPQGGHPSPLRRHEATPHLVRAPGHGPSHGNGEPRRAPPRARPLGSVGSPTRSASGDAGMADTAGVARTPACDRRPH